MRLRISKARRKSTGEKAAACFVFAIDPADILLFHHSRFGVLVAAHPSPWRRRVGLRGWRRVN